MKWHTNCYLENRAFDSRLVKEDLVQWSSSEPLGHYPEIKDYRNLMPSYPWSTSNGDPCKQNVYGIPPRQGTSYMTARPLPWKPANELIEMNSTLPERLAHNGFTSVGSPSEGITFPNLVTGFERNPQHAARAALYTRYTPGEWVENCLSKFSESNVNRNISERLRNEAVRVIRETDEKICQGQRDAGRRLGERLTDVTFWRNELNTEMEKIQSEISTLQESKKKTGKALEDLEGPLHVAQECLYNREKRKDMEKVHDNVEKSLLLEIDIIRRSQAQLRDIYDRASRQLQDNRSAQFALEEDVGLKESALGIDSVCHQLNNNSRGINYYGGIEKFDPSVSTMEAWAQSSGTRINKSQNERGKSIQIRSEIDTLVNATTSRVWDHWSNTNNALDRRSSELSEAKNKVQLHLHKVQNEIFDMERHIALLQKSIHDASHPLKVAQTRLEARAHRPGVELCKDFAQMRIVQEVHEIHESVRSLHHKLQEAESQHQQLLKTRANLEADLHKKVESLFIDREKCMGLRRSFPVDNLIKY
ncbi:TEKT3 family protein [Megaselia abdita]